MIKIKTQLFLICLLWNKSTSYSAFDTIYAISSTDTKAIAAGDKENSLPFIYQKKIYNFLRKRTSSFNWKWLGKMVAFTLFLRGITYLILLWSSIRKIEPGNEKRKSKPTKIESFFMQLKSKESRRFAYHILSEKKFLINSLTCFYIITCSGYFLDPYWLHAHPVMFLFYCCLLQLIAEKVNNWYLKSAQEETMESSRTRNQFYHFLCKKKDLNLSDTIILNPNNIPNNSGIQTILDLVNEIHKSITSIITTNKEVDQDKKHLKRLKNGFQTCHNDIANLKKLIEEKKNLKFKKIKKNKLKIDKELEEVEKELEKVENHLEKLRKDTDKAIELLPAIELFFNKKSINQLGAQIIFQSPINPSKQMIISSPQKDLHSWITKSTEKFLTTYKSYLPQFYKKINTPPLFNKKSLVEITKIQKKKCINYLNNFMNNLLYKKNNDAQNMQQLRLFQLLLESEKETYPQLYSRILNRLNNNKATNNLPRKKNNKKKGISTINSNDMNDWHKKEEITNKKIIKYQAISSLLIAFLLPIIASLSDQLLRLLQGEGEKFGKPEFKKIY